jgi:hypothetical protein
MKRLLLTVSVLCLFMIGYATANGADWVHYSTSSAGDWYYDKGSIAYTGKDTIKVWQTLVYSERGKQKEMEARKEAGFYNVKYDDLKFTLDHYVIKCSTGEVGLSGLAHYSSEGRVISSTSFPPSYSPILPNTILEGLYKIVCKNKK